MVVIRCEQCQKERAGSDLPVNWMELRRGGQKAPKHFCCDLCLTTFITQRLLTPKEERAAQRAGVA